MCSGSNTCWGSHLRQGAKTPEHDKAPAVESEDPEAKASRRSSLDEGPVHRCGCQPPSCTIAKGPKRRYKDGWKPSERGVADSLGEGPDPKPWSKASGGEGSGTRLGPACRASCNPFRVCRVDIT